MGFGFKKKTATDQWKHEKEQERAKLQESHGSSASASDSRSSSWSSSASHSSLQKVQYPSGPFPDGPRNCLALPLPNLLSGIAVCVPNRQQFERQESGNPVFDSVAVAAQFGVDLLHSYKGFRALVTTGTQILQLSRDANVRCRDPSQAAHHAADFLSRVTDAFPIIAVHNLRDMNARTNKGRWEVPQDRMFPPHHAAVIELNRVLIDRVLEARDAIRRNRRDSVAWDRFHTLLFRIGVTLAHELCHVFTSYLLYDHGQHTPPAVTYGQYYTNRSVGESGRFWESQTFGGFVDMRQGSRIERVGIRHDKIDNTMIISPASCRAMMTRDFSLLPFAEDFFAKEQDSSFVLPKLDWDTRYSNIFAQYATAPRPNELPQPVLDDLMDGKGVYHRIPAKTLRDWTLDCETVLGGKANWSCTVKMQA